MKNRIGFALRQIGSEAVRVLSSRQMCWAVVAMLGVGIHPTVVGERIEIIGTVLSVDFAQTIVVVGKKLQDDPFSSAELQHNRSNATSGTSGIGGDGGGSSSAGSPGALETPKADDTQEKPKSENDTEQKACDEVTGNPVAIATGEKYLAQSDLVLAGEYGLTLKRSNRSAGSGAMFGAKWANNLQGIRLTWSGTKCLPEAGRL